MASKQEISFLQNPINKQVKEKQADDLSFMPGIDYSDNREAGATGGNLVREIGNRADKDKPGKVTLSGYIIDQDSREPVAGVTVYVPGLSAGTISNAFGFYKIDMPRETYSVRFTFIGIEGKSI